MCVCRHPCREAEKFELRITHSWHDMKFRLIWCHVCLQSLQVSGRPYMWDSSIYSGKYLGIHAKKLQMPQVGFKVHSWSLGYSTTSQWRLCVWDGQTWKWLAHIKQLIGWAVIPITLVGWNITVEKFRKQSNKHRPEQPVDCADGESVSWKWLENPCKPECGRPMCCKSHCAWDATIPCNCSPQKCFRRNSGERHSRHLVCNPTPGWTCTLETRTSLWVLPRHPKSFQCHPP